MIEDGLSGRTALFWAPPRGRGPMPRSWRRWAFGQDGKHASLAGGSAAFVLVLHCINTYKDGCSASEARQAVGEGRGAVVTGTHLAEAIHRLALWMGGLSTVGAICTLRQHSMEKYGWATKKSRCPSHRFRRTGAPSMIARYCRGGCPGPMLQQSCSGREAFAREDRQRSASSRSVATDFRPSTP